MGMEEMVSDLKKHPLETPIPVHVAACRIEIPPPIQVESQPAITLMMQEMVSELSEHALETPIPVQVESQPFVSKSMTPKFSVPLEEETSEAEESVESVEVMEKTSEVDVYPTTEDKWRGLARLQRAGFNITMEMAGLASDSLSESSEVVQKVNVDIAIMSMTEDSDSVYTDALSVSSITCMDSLEMETQAFGGRP